MFFESAEPLFPGFIDKLVAKYNEKILPKINAKRAVDKQFKPVDLKTIPGSGLVLDTLCNLAVGEFLPKTTVKSPKDPSKTIKAIYPLDICAGKAFEEMAERGGAQGLVGNAILKFYGTTAKLMCASFMKQQGAVKPEDTTEFMADVMATL